MNAHLIPVITDRGFQHMPDIWDNRRVRVRTYESSAAEAPHIWLSIDEPDHQPAVVHLPIDQARELAEQLLYLVEHHYQVVDR